MTIGIYVRVSSNTQSTRSQKAELEKWAAAQNEPVKWYEDVATGTNMDRKHFNRLLEDCRSGKIDTVTVWRLDRLGRTAKGLLGLFDEFESLGCEFVSLKEHLVLTTPAGHLMLVLLAGIAQFETEMRTERQRAGIAAARARGVKWGSRKVGTRITLTLEKEKLAQQLKAQGKTIVYIAKNLGLSRKSIYKALAAKSA